MLGPSEENKPDKQQRRGKNKIHNTLEKIATIEQQGQRHLGIWALGADSTKLDFSLVMAFDDRQSADSQMDKWGSDGLNYF